MLKQCRRVILPFRWHILEEALECINLGIRQVDFTILGSMFAFAHFEARCECDVGGKERVVGKAGGGGVAVEAQLGRHTERGGGGEGGHGAAWHNSQRPKAVAVGP
jgi:hypothetical protein